MKNTHLEHPEDMILTGDLSVLDWFTGGGHVSLKYDGAPAVVWGNHPKTHRFFVGTKSVFNKVKIKINYSHSDIDSNHTGEVAKILNLVNKKNGTLNTHTIRFWEKEFKQIKPKIFAGRRRYYDKKSVQLLKKIRFLLKEKGLTINGVKKFLLNESSFNLDETSNRSINTSKNNLKSKLEKISNLLKEIKKLG